MNLQAEISTRETTQPAAVEGAIGSLSVRLARSALEIRAIQALRHEVFFDETPAVDTAVELDADRFDPYCDHLMVTQSGRMEIQGAGDIFGTYRLLRQEVAMTRCGFYSAGEFQIEPLVTRHKDKKFLELGRSCVRPLYRNKRTIELLWHGTWSYAVQNKVDVLFGCASFPGTDPASIADCLAYLHHHHLAASDWQVLPAHRQAIDLARFSKSDVNVKAALKALPPLIKGYLRLGASVGQYAVIDESFGSIDVLILLPVANISRKYLNYYGPKAERHRVR